MTCSNSSGIVNIVNQQINLTIVDCKLTGSNLIESNYNGYITSTIVLVPLSVFINNFFVCVSNISSSGNQSIQIQFNAILQCDLCGGSSVVYGVCQDTLIHGQHVYGMLQCVHPFIFSNNQCICDQGYVLDQLNCVNIIQAMHNISISVNNGLSQRVVNIENAIQEQDIRISQNISQIQSELYSTLSVLENYIISNFSQSQDNLQVNLATIDKQIFENVTLLSNNIYSNQLTLQNYILQNSTILDWRIYNNISALKYNITLEINDFKLSQYEILSDLKNQQQLKINQMQDTITNLIQQIDCTNLAGQFINGSCVYNICPVQGQKLINGVCQCVNTNAIIQNNVCACPKYSTLIGFICTCPDNSSLVSGVCTCLVAGQTINSGECSCSSGQSVIDGSCQTVVIINGSDSSFQCSQSVQVTTFDIQTVTNQLSTPLSFSQYQIFATSNIIIDAFIDISDQVYSTVNPLFQSQNSFNNIKIQIGTQIITGGSILVPNTTLTIKINQLNIISKIGSQITVSSYIYILLSSSQSTDIKTLLVNLSFAMSSGNITLINIVSGIINITGYQVVRNYQSTNQVSMIALTVNSVIGDISHVNFRPTIYNVGNCSSYIFSTLSSAEFTLTSVAILIGNSSSVQVLTSISSSSSNQYLFGGIFAKILGSSKIIIHNVISDCIQQISTSYTQYFGFLVGYGQSSSGSITVVNLCQQQKEIINSQEVNCLGIVGNTFANTSLQQVIVTITVQVTFLAYFGLVGVQGQGSLYSEVINARTFIIINSNYGSSVGALFGFARMLNGSIQNVTLVNSSLTSQYYVGGLIGQSNGNSIILIQNTILTQSYLAGQYYIGGCIGYSYSSFIVITSSQFMQMRLSAISYPGIILGYNQGGTTFSFSNSSSVSNQINTIIQQDCPSLSNAFSQIGC
ncbi:Conserved_hypothetical protein [Hexamita inflata]|uniref:Transmembrane protein n=1 Tax=Hexamita inflata TaxID=28002 RepID=A0ABP1J624_9EUKA